MEENAPGTKAELQTELRDVRVEIHQLEGRLLARMEKTQTNLLIAFRSWPRRSETR